MRIDTGAPRRQREASSQVVQDEANQQCRCAYVGEALGLFNAAIDFDGWKMSLIGKTPNWKGAEQLDEADLLGRGNHVGGGRRLGRRQQEEVKCHCDG